MHIKIVLHLYVYISFVTSYNISFINSWHLCPIDVCSTFSTQFRVNYVFQKTYFSVLNNLWWLITIMFFHNQRDTNKHIYAPSCCNKNIVSKHIQFLSSVIITTIKLFFRFSVCILAYSRKAQNLDHVHDFHRL